MIETMKTPTRGAVRRLADVDGFLLNEEGECLYRLARGWTGRGAILEIGSWKGRSTIWLGHGLRASRAFRKREYSHGAPPRIYAIDPHQGECLRGELVAPTFEDFQRNIARAALNDVVQPLLQTSLDAARDFAEPVEIVFIDGLHDYEAVREDFETWFPRVLAGGWMAFHDSVWHPEVARLVREAVYLSPHFADVRFCGSITVARKVAHNTPRQRLENRAMLLAKEAVAATTTLSFLPERARWLVRRAPKLPRIALRRAVARLKKSR